VAPESETLSAWAQAAALGRATSFLRERFGIPDVGGVEALKDLVDRLSHREPAQAVDRARELVAYADGGPDVSARAVARLALANAYLWSERLEEAGATYEAARRTAQEAGDVALAARCGVGQLGVLFRLGRYRDALELADVIEPVLRAHHHTALYGARVQSQRATVLQYLGRTEEALRTYAAASSYFRAVGPAGCLDLAVAQHNAGLLLAQLGRYEEAAAALQEARAAAEASGTPLLAARAGAAGAWADLVQGRYAQALHALEQVARAYAAAGVRAAAAAYRLFGLECWLHLGHAERVRREGPRLARELEAAGLVAEAARARYLTALGHGHTGELESAVSLLQQAYVALSEVGREGWRAAVACELAALRVRSGDAAGALALVGEARRAWQRVGDPSGEGRALLVLSDALRLAQDVEGAAEAARDALRTGYRHRLAWLCAAAHRRLSVLRPARRSAHLLRGVRWADRVLAWAPPDLRWGMFAELSELYAHAVEDLWARGRPRRAWEVAQGAKSRGMAALLASHGLRLRERRPQDAALVQEVNRLLDAYRSSLLPELGDGKAASTPSAAEPDLEGRIQDALWRLQLQDGAYGRDAQLVGFLPRPASPPLEPDTVLLEYFAASGSVLAFVVEPGGRVTARRTCTLREVVRAAALFVHGLSTHARGLSPARQAARQAQRVLEELYRLLVAPVEDVLRKFPRLVVAPFGVLHALPFHAFADGGACVWDRWEVSFIPAGSLLALLRDAPSGSGPAVCVADGLWGRLPGVVAEARWVAEYLGARLVEQPSPREFLQALRGAPWAHVAAHCRFRPEAPLLSAVYLTAGPVTAADVMTSAPGCPVVVLSGCETGASTVLPGDELMGFVRAWFHAGARALVLSLWPVEDSATAGLMQRFYGALRRRGRVPEALREAGLATRDVRPHPWEWAGFVVTGDPTVSLPKPAPAALTG
jgi:tetratricopeptide (TPR) repeat protein